MRKRVRYDCSRLLAAFLGVCYLPTISWGFFPPIDLYPPPVSFPPAVVPEQPIPPVPDDPIVTPPINPSNPNPITTPPVTPPAQVPEPGTITLALFGLGGIYGYRRSQRSK